MTFITPKSNGFALSARLVCYMPLVSWAAHPRLTREEASIQPDQCARDSDGTADDR